MLGLGGKGNPMLKHLSLPQVILFVWISSSIVEEVLTRVFLQSHLSHLKGSHLSLGFIRIEWPVLISAVFFSCMHLSLLFSDTDAISIITILLFTLSLGFLCGYLRSRTESIIPAIIAHSLANIGGMIGGMLYLLLSFALKE